MRWYHQMLLIRRFEEKVLDLANAGLVHGPAHASIGQEATAVGAMSMLGTGDRINGTHRAHHQVLAKLVNAQTPAGFDPLHDAFNPDMQGSVRGLMAEIMGLNAGLLRRPWRLDAYARRRLRHSRHQRHHRRQPAACGGLCAGRQTAWNRQHFGRLLRRRHDDGGPAYEAMNIAALYRLPVIFFAENNFYAVSTHVNEQTRETRLASRGPMLGFRGIECDGMDVVAVHHAMREARRVIEEEGGPVLVEALCYRFLHQSGARPGSEFGYRTRAEEDAWKARDPLTTMAARLKTMGILDASDLATLDQRVMEVVNTAADLLTEMSGNALRIPDHLWPAPAKSTTRSVGDLSELRDERFLEIEDVPPAETRPVKFMVAASEVIARAMEQDPRIIIMGEDVHRLRGGVSGATKGALERWPERVLAMPIAENGFVGVALGAALCGLRPIVEIMFGDFCLVAADQLFNGGQQGASHVRRRLSGADRGAGPRLAAHRLRLAAFGRSVRPVRALSRLAHRRADDALRLCRADEFGAEMRRPGASSSSMSNCSRAKAPFRPMTETIACGSARRKSSGQAVPARC